MIKKIFYSTLLSLGVLFTSHASETTTNKTEEISFWNQTSLVLEQEFRLKEDTFYYEHTDLTLSYKLNKYITPFAGYRMMLEDKSDGWDLTHRVHLGASVAFKQDWGKIDFRSRFEYTFDEEVDGDFRFRERFKYNVPWKWTKYEINPFIYDEVFFDIDDADGFVRNRLGGGLEYKVSKNLTGTLYYFLESKKSKNRWDDANILALNLKYKF